MGLTYSEVLIAVKGGCCAFRRGWNGKGMHIYLVRKGSGGDMTQDFLAIVTVGNDRIPWTPTPADQLADDWELLS